MHLETAQGLACDTTGRRQGKADPRAPRTKCRACIGTYEWKGRASADLIRSRRRMGIRLAGDPPKPKRRR